MKRVQIKIFFSLVNSNKLMFTPLRDLVKNKMVCFSQTIFIEITKKRCSFFPLSILVQREIKLAIKLL